MIALILALQAAAPATGVPSHSDEAKTIVVIGPRRRKASEALAACIARGCPPNEEIVASLLKADAEFIEGDYVAGRRSMGAARRRNGRYAKQYPELVSEISRVDSRLASLLGQRDEQRLAAAQAVDALRAGLPANDPRVLMQRLEVGDAYLLTGSRFDEAHAIYRQVAEQAKAAGQMTVYGRALLRPAIMYLGLSLNGALYRPAMRQALAKIDATTEPELASVRDVAVMLRMRLAMAGGTKEEVDAALAALAKRPVAVPVVAYAPAVNLGMAGGEPTGLRDLELANADASILSQANFNPEFSIDKQWVDVSFWVTPEGKVRDVEVVRQGDPSVKDWIPAVRKALNERRYVPLAMDHDGPGVLRLERYSMVSDERSRSFSRLKGRTDAPHVEMTDLSNSTLARTLRAN